MKKLTHTVFAAMLMLAASLTASAQSGEARSVSGFNAISSSGSFDVHVKIDGTESLKIDASEAVIAKIETVVEDGKLKIRWKERNNWNDNDYGKINIYVEAKSLNSLANSGSGSTDVDGVVSGDRVNIILSGSGNIKTSVKAGELRIAISGSGSMRIDGSADEAKLSVVGSGELKGKELKAGTVSANIAGSGSAYIYAEKSVSGRIAGSGNLVYSGNASVADSRTAGSGRISKAD